MEVCLGKLLREEQHLASQLNLAQDADGFEIVIMAYIAKYRGRSRSPAQHYSCKKIGHIVKHCNKKFCNYCKEGHIIKDCCVHPNNRSVPTFHTTHIAVHSTLVPTSSALPAIPSSSYNIAPKQLQQMIIFALFDLSLKVKKHLLTSPYLIDFVASNHMTGNWTTLQDIQKYDGEQHIRIANRITLPIIANGNTLPITVIENLGSSFTNVFLSTDLCANLIYVGQLVEKNCSLHFNRSGCRVQDQASRQETPRGLKGGHFFSSLSHFPFLIHFLSVALYC